MFAVILSYYINISDLWDGLINVGSPYLPKVETISDLWAGLISSQLTIHF